MALLDAVRDATGDELLKVILETGELSDLDTVRAATRLAIDHGADFVKTSTGKTPVSATPAAVRAMLDVIHTMAGSTRRDQAVGRHPHVRRRARLSVDRR